jgi:hypothetical protein
VIVFPAAALGLHRRRSLAVVGIVKNAGKTVVIGRLLAEARALGRVVGVLSTGMDGERRDAVFGHAKPPVVVAPGMWVATAREGIAAAEAGLVVVHDTGVATPFGAVALARVVASGRVTLIGPRSLTQVARVMGALWAAGADLVLVDGSVDRRSVAAAVQTEAVVLVVGAAFSRDLTAVVREAQRVLALLRLPAATTATDDWPAAPDILDERGRRVASELPSALTAEAPLAAFAAAQRARVLRCPGAVSGRLLAALIEKGATPIRLIAHDGTRVFASAGEVRRFQQAGGQIEVRRAIELAGVAINPYAPEGYWLPAEELAEQVRALVPDRPVFDAVRD